MNQALRLLLRRQHRSLSDLADQLASVLQFDEAVSLAYQERTGDELQPGDAYTAADAARAQEIMRLFLEKDA